MTKGGSLFEHDSGPNYLQIGYKAVVFTKAPLIIYHIFKIKFSRLEGNYVMRSRFINRQCFGNFSFHDLSLSCFILYYYINKNVIKSN